MNKESLFNVALVGLGNIGMGYDLDLSESDFVLSHARAFAQSPHFRLVLGVDKDVRLRQEFGEKYAVETVENIEDCAAIDAVDLVVVATSTPSHLAVIKEAIRVFSPKAILCEKPLATNLKDAEALVDHCDSEKIDLFVNFIRRADPAVNWVRNSFASREFISPFTGTAWYSRGLFNTASHFTDMLEYWFGPPKRIESIGVIRPAAIGEDVCADFRVYFSNGYVTFQSLPAETISNNELDIWFCNGHLQYTSNGRIFWSDKISGDFITDGLDMKAGRVEIPNEMKCYQRNIVRELYIAMMGLPNTLCSGRSALGWNYEFEKLLNEKRVVL